jgi:hypothetical protein
VLAAPTLRGSQGLRVRAPTPPSVVLGKVQETGYEETLAAFFPGGVRCQAPRPCRLVGWHRDIFEEHTAIREVHDA